MSLTSADRSQTSRPKSCRTATWTATKPGISSASALLHFARGTPGNLPVTASQRVLKPSLVQSSNNYEQEPEVITKVLLSAVIMFGCRGGGSDTGLCRPQRIRQPELQLRAAGHWPAARSCRQGSGESRNPERSDRWASQPGSPQPSVQQLGAGGFGRQPRALIRLARRWRGAYHLAFDLRAHLDVVVLLRFTFAPTTTGRNRRRHQRRHHGETSAARLGAMRSPRQVAPESASPAAAPPRPAAGSACPSKLRRPSPPWVRVPHRRS